MTKNPWKTVTGNGDDWRHPSDYRVHPFPVHMPPQPWVGNFTQGRVCWLLGGFGTGDQMAYMSQECRQTVKSWALKNLHCEEPIEPNLWLVPRDDTDALEHTRDVHWWLAATRKLRDALELSMTADAARETLSRKLFVLESYPYAMSHNPGKLLPTHEYTKHLLQAWIKTGRPVIVGRSRAFWYRLIPELGTRCLEGDGQFDVAVNARRASISPNNLLGGEASFRRIVKALTAE